MGWHWNFQYFVHYIMCVCVCAGACVCINDLVFDGGDVLNCVAWSMKIWSTFRFFQIQKTTKLPSNCVIAEEFGRIFIRLFSFYCLSHWPTTYEWIYFSKVVSNSNKSVKIWSVCHIWGKISDIWNVSKWVHQQNDENNLAVQSLHLFFTKFLPIFLCQKQKKLQIDSISRDYLSLLNLTYFGPWKARCCCCWCLFDWISACTSVVAVFAQNTPIHEQSSYIYRFSLSIKVCVRAL